MLACTIPIFCMPFVYHCWHVHINVACIHVASCMLLVHWAFNLIANSLNLFLFKVQKTLEGLLEHYSGEFSFNSHFLLHSPQNSFTRSTPSPGGGDWQDQQRGSWCSYCQNTNKVLLGAAFYSDIGQKYLVVLGEWWLWSGGSAEVRYWGQAGDGGVRELCLTYMSL